MNETTGTLATAVRVQREVAPAEALAAMMRLRALHTALENLGHYSTLPSSERVVRFMSALVPQFARSMTCEMPDEPPLRAGELVPGDYVIQTVIARTSGGRLIARRSIPFTSEDSAILLAAANAIALLYWR